MEQTNIMKRRVNRNPLRKIMYYDHERHYLECGHELYINDSAGASRRRCFKCRELGMEKIGSTHSLILCKGQLYHQTVDGQTLMVQGMANVYLAEERARQLNVPWSEE